MLTAIVVGTILALINQSGALLEHGITPPLAARVGLTYAVPYLVSTWGALGASVLRGAAREAPRSEDV